MTLPRERDEEDGGMDRALLTIYLNEHLAGAAAEIELVQTIQEEVERDAPLGILLAELAADLARERTLIENLLARGGGSIEPPPDRAPARPPRQSWISVWLGRGEAPSPAESQPRLARLLHLEGLLAARQWRLSLWEVLGTVHPETDEGEIDYADLEARVIRQIEDLASQRSRAAGAAFSK